MMATLPTVLLVDADAESARPYSEALQRAGFRVEVTAPGSDRHDLPPDVVVLSVPQLNRSMVRVVTNGRPVPRIVISSNVRDSTPGPEFDCAAVLIRPVMYDDLVTTVRRVLKSSDASSPA